MGNQQVRAIEKARARERKREREREKKRELTSWVYVDILGV